MAKYKTLIPIKAEVVAPNSNNFKAIADTLKTKYGFELKPQMDLMYVRSCLVTANINENDDAFTKAELWAARHTPVLKPTNWQHVDKDIVGVIYSVEARTLDGNIIDFDQIEPPDEEYELFTEAAIFGLIHPDKAQEIKARAEKGNLFVSMEAWFDDYDYVEVNDDGSFNRIIGRNENTAFLDQYLRSHGGTGKYNNKRVGRALRSITFGGYGFVNNPANKRSEITDVRNFIGNQSDADELVGLLQKLVNGLKPIQEKVLMAANANEITNPKVLTSAEIVEVLDKREQEKAKAAEDKAVRDKVVELTKANESLQKEVTDLKSKSNTDSTTELENIQNMNVAVDTIMKDIAGATGSTPPEIKKIDSVTDGTSAFNAKISWIKDSVKAMATKAAKASELEAELEKASLAFREQEITNLFNGLVAADELEVLLKVGASKEEEAYNEWYSEKELFASMLKAKKEEVVDEEEEEELPFKKGKKVKSDATPAEMFASLLAKRKSQADPHGNPADAIPHLQDDVKEIPGSNDIKSGVNSGSLKTPRFKIAGGTADSDPDKVLSKAIPKKSVNLAGANYNGEGAEDKDPFGFKALASELCQAKEDEKDASEKPSFDPIG